MMNDDIMVLDAYNTIYVWIGKMSNKFEKKNSINTAQKYLDSVQDERDKSEVTIVDVEAGKETPSFTVQFSSWSREQASLWLEGDPMKKYKGAGGSQQVQEEEKKQEVKKIYLDHIANKYDLNTLQTSFPEGVDPARKEAYLNEKDFNAVFGMDMEKFLTQKAWK